LPKFPNPGWNYVNRAARALHGIASEVRVLDLPGLGPRTEKHGKDLSDWLLLEGNTKEKLCKLIASAPLWQPFKDEASCEQEIERLARLSAIAYEIARPEAARALGFRADVLDTLVKNKRRSLGLDKNDAVLVRRTGTAYRTERDARLPRGSNRVGRLDRPIRYAAYLRNHNWRTG
jgi:hypothetical protein